MLRTKRRLLPIVLFAVYVAQCAWFVGTQSLVYDEPLHLRTGLDAWRYGRFYETNQPPLGQLLLTLPLLRDGWEIRDDPAPARVQPHPEVVASWARAPNVAMGLLLAWLLWLTARRYFSEAGANLALVLFAFSPPLVAHFSLATVDGIATLLVFAAAVQLARWRHNPTRWPTVLLGAVLGLLLAAKLYAVPLFMLAWTAVLVLKPGQIARRPSEWNWRAAACVLGVAFVVLWGCYFFHVSRVTFDRAGVRLEPGAPVDRGTAKPMTLSLPIPAGEYLSGLQFQMKHQREGHPSFFLGNVSPTGGWKLYFPVTILLKWPTVVLAMAATALLLALRGSLSLSRDLLLMSTLPALLFGVAIFSKLNIGDRYVLPLYPFLLLSSAALWQLSRPRGVRALLLAAVAAHGADCLRYAPDYLSYFNVFVRPERSYELLTDSNLDWGQGLLALRRYEAEHPQEDIHLAYFGRMDPAQYGIRARWLDEGERVSGTVVISATSLSGQYLDDPSSYHWVLKYPRKAILNHSLHVFDVRNAPSPDETAGRRHQE